ncbi:Putative uncharacterized protein [Moritella viscosa]|uniref:Integrase n=2 Tax=Moritella viscosa TaxID=80854 RepID=A0A1L0AM80_9GAMM|nr:Putative uncharacterized protein [Moritella viscosa]
MSYLIKSPYGIYYFRWSLLVDNKYKQTKISLRTKCKLTAIKEAATIALELRDNPPTTIQQLKHHLSTYFESPIHQTTPISGTLENLEPLLFDLAPKSLSEYKSVWNAFINHLLSNIGDIDLHSITQTQVESWRNKQKCTSVTLRKKLRVISSCLNKLDFKETLEFTVKTPKKADTVQRRAFTTNELKYFLKATEDHSGWKYYLPRMALLTGCRMNELCQLRKSDFRKDEDQYYISINTDTPDKQLKNKSSHREIPISKNLKILVLPLLNSKKQNDLLFDLTFSQYNRYISQPSKFFSKIIDTSRKDQKMGIGVTFHSLRHNVVTSLFNQGVTEELIGSITGHSMGKSTAGKNYMSGFSYQRKLNTVNKLSLV